MSSTRAGSSGIFCENEFTKPNLLYFGEYLGQADKLVLSVPTVSILLSHWPGEWCGERSLTGPQLEVNWMCQFSQGSGW